MSIRLASNRTGWRALGNNLLRTRPRVALDGLSWWAACVVIWACVVLVLTATGLIAVSVVDLGEGYHPGIGVEPDSLPGIWARWDSGYYIAIAREGYATHLGYAGFFPLYPLLMGSLAGLFGIGVASAGLVISQLSFFAALIVFYRLGNLLSGRPDQAMRGVLFLALFPTSFFFIAIYAEGLGLALSIAATYFAIRRRWVLAGLSSGFASVARPVGFMLNAVLIVEFAHHIRQEGLSARSLRGFLAGILLSVSGVIAYVVYLYSLTGTLLAIPNAQSDWKRTLDFPWATIAGGIQTAVLWTDVPSDWFLYVANLYDLGFAAFAILLTIISIKRIRPSLVAYLIGSVVLVLSSRGVEPVPLWGCARWVAALFPLFLVQADVLRSVAVRRTILVASAVALVLFTAWWTSGRWVG